MQQEKDETNGPTMPMRITNVDCYRFPLKYANCNKTSDRQTVYCKEIQLTTYFFLSLIYIYILDSRQSCRQRLL